MFDYQIIIWTSSPLNILRTYFLQSNSAHAGFFIMPSYLFDHNEELIEK